MNKIFTALKENETESFKPLTVKDVKAIRSLYDSYNEAEEFLYVPSDEELTKSLTGDESAYLGNFVNNKLVGIGKIGLVESPSPFFANQFDAGKGKVFLGFSGMLVHSDFRQQGIATKMLKEATRIKDKINAIGIYADCDYRNIKSFNILNKNFNLLGFTDGRNGAEGEKTIYITFYKSFNTNLTPPMFTAGLNLDSSVSKEQAFTRILSVMNKFGPVHKTTVPYGEGYNDIYTFRSALPLQRVAYHKLNPAEFLKCLTAYNSSVKEYTA